MRLVRESIARLLVGLAVLAATAALGTWWASLLALRSAGTLTEVAKSELSKQIGTRLDRLAPHTTNLAALDSTIRRALDDPAVTQAIVTSEPEGSKALSQELGSLDKGLGPLLSGGNVLSGVDLANVGQHTLAQLAVRLREAARDAAIVAAAAAALALVLSPSRHLILRHLASSAALVAGLSLVVSWWLPETLADRTRGNWHTIAKSALSGGAPVRSVVLACLIAGVAVYLATRLFELVPGRRVAYDPTQPVPRGKIV